MQREAETEPAERPQLRLRDNYLFFFPLVLMVELNMISKSAIHAFLARTETPSTTLAAFNAGFTFYFAITSATEVVVLLCLSYLKSRGRHLAAGRLYRAAAQPLLRAGAGDRVHGRWQRHVR